MKKLNLNTLLKKRVVKGEELGRAIVTNLVHDLRNGMNPGHQSLFSQNDLERMQNSLESPYEAEVYARYVDLYNGTILQHWRALASLQKACHGYYKYFFLLMAEFSSERGVQRLLSLPEISTQRQYNDELVKQMTQKRALEENFKGIILHALDYYLGHYTTEALQVPSEVEAALAALRVEPFRNQRILGLINEQYEIGYYLFPKGKDSRQLTEDQFLAQLRTLEPFKSMPDIARLWDKNKSPDSNEIRLAQVLGVDKVRRFKAQVDKVDVDESDEIWPCWRIKAEPPSGLSCWDVLAGDYSMKGTYFGILQKYKDQEAVLFKDFTKDFPDLYRALKEDVIRRTGWKYLENISAEEAIKCTTTWGELADLGVYGYPEIKKPGRYYDWDEDCLRLIREGRAILKGDEGGQAYSETVEPLTGEAVMADGKEGQVLASTREDLIVSPWRELGAYSALLSILGEQYGVPELTQLEIDMSLLKEQLEFLNSFLQAFFKELPRMAPKTNVPANTIEAAKTYLKYNSHTVRLSDLEWLMNMLLGAKK